MKDIDFDELDRAVSSMVSGSNNNISAKPVGQNSNISKSMDGVSLKPGVNMDGIVSRSVSPNLSDSNNQRTISLASRRSAGRFFDMVRPQKQPASKPEPTVLHMASSPESNDQNATQPEPVIDTNSEQENKPDLGVSISVNQKSPVVEKPVISEPQPTVRKVERTSIFSNNFIKRPTIADPSDLPESPFLTDAKVDKRPLGAFSAGGTVQSPTMAPDPQPISVTDTVSVTSGTSNIEPKQDFPVELSADLLQIESNGTQSNSTPPTNPQPVVTTQNSISQATSSSQSQNLAPVINGGDQASASIYDTSHFQKTISHPTKVKNGWMWVVWIAVLVIIGGGAGAAVYFLFY